MSHLKMDHIVFLVLLPSLDSRKLLNTIDCAQPWNPQSQLLARPVKRRVSIYYANGLESLHRHAAAWSWGSQSKGREGAFLGLRRRYLGGEQRKICLCTNGFRTGWPQIEDCPSALECRGTIRLLLVPSFTEAILNGLLAYLSPRCFEYVNFFHYFVSRLHTANVCLHKMFSIVRF
jgi:hypothetical protein